LCVCVYTYNTLHMDIPLVMPSMRTRLSVENTFYREHIL